MLLCSCGKYRSPQQETELRPVIQYVDTFIKDHKRLPTQDEFRTNELSHSPMFVLRERTNRYAASKGARADTDYMVGDWGGDWFYYYKSWDKTFIDGSDEQL
jgi:hypothetical protein